MRCHAGGIDEGAMTRKQSTVPRKKDSVRGTENFSEAALTAPPVADLRGWVQHKPDCWLQYKTRDLVPGAEGGMRFRQSGDPEPSCTCGLDEALKSEA